MKIFFSLFLLFTLKAYGNCDFRENVKSVYSLSGPVSKTLEEIQLLSSPRVKGISIFYPTTLDKKKIPGGIFIAPGLLNEMKNSLVIYDESQELKKLFDSQGIHTISLNSRGKSPHEVMEESERVVRPFLKGCDDKLLLLQKKIAALESEIRKKSTTKKDIVFFLGEVNDGKLPDLVVANDGIARWLKENKLVSGYPSELAYVNWSARVLGKIPQSTIYLGLKEAPKPGLKGQSLRMTLEYPGALMPGMTQLEAWIYFLDHIPRDKL